MRFDLHAWICITALFAFCVFGSPIRAAESQIVFATHDLHPYGSIQDDGRFSGIAADVVTCVMARMDRPYRNAVVPWKRAQMMVRRGQAAGFYAGSRNAERAAYAVPSAVIADQKWVWYLRKDSAMTPGKESFKAKARVASFVGANMHKWLQNNDFNVTANPKTSAQLLLMVAKGRLDAALVNNVVGRTVVAELQLTDQLRTVVNRDKPLSLHLSKAFLKKEPGFLTAFNSHVAACR